MTTYLMKVRDLQRGFTSFKVTKVSQKDTEHADALAKLASTNPKKLFSDSKSYNNPTFSVGLR